MAKPTGFMEYARENPQKRPIEEQVRDYREIEGMLPFDRLETQAARCMDCGVPSCHTFGCPVKNRIPDWNDMVYKKQWRHALDLLQATNPLPEITGRVCPAPCEAACTLSINQLPVTIRHIELEIVERGFQEGWIRPEPPSIKSGKNVAVIGSGPAALAAAQTARRLGHNVVVFEKNDRVGGILRYGIPDFKLEKWVIDRQLEQLRAEGVIFETGVNVGLDLSAKYMLRTFDAAIITAGAGVPRDINVPGRDLGGIHFALAYLTQQNRVNAGDRIPGDQVINAKGKQVLVIGGGDTGSDCVGTARRQGAASIHQIELLPEPPIERPGNNPWPTWPQILRTSSSHEEGCARLFSVGTSEFTGEAGHVRSARCLKLDWSKPDKDKKTPYSEIQGSGFELKADLVLLSMGFLHIEHGPLVKDLELEVCPRGNLRVDAQLMTTRPGIFAAGDSEMGASLVVRAIDRGRTAAICADRHLKM